MKKGAGLKLSHRAQGEKTRRKILKSALELFARQGYYKTSITQIVKKSGSYRAGIEWHFGSKKGLLVAVLDKYLDEKLIPELKFWLNKSLDHMINYSEVKTHNTLFNDLTIFMKNNQGIILTLFTLTFEQNRREPKIRERVQEAWDKISHIFEEMVQSRAKARGLEMVVEPRILARFILAQAQGAFIKYYLKPTRENAKEIFDQLAEVFIFLYLSAVREPKSKSFVGSKSPTQRQKSSDEFSVSP